MKAKRSRRSALTYLAAIAACLAASTAGATMSINAPATSWRIQTFGAGKIVLWYTGSTCASGQLSISANEPLEQYRLVAAMVLSSKATGDKMVVDYDVVNGTCTITDIGVDGP